MTAMTCTSLPTTFVLVDVDDRRAGERIRQRRVALGLSERALAKESGINRETVKKAEDDTPGVRQTTYAKLESTLNRLEEVMGADTPDLVTSTIDLPDGTRVMFAGPADGVAESVAKYLRQRETAG